MAEDGARAFQIDEVCGRMFSFNDFAGVAKCAKVCKMWRSCASLSETWIAASRQEYAKERKRIFTRCLEEGLFESGHLIESIESETQITVAQWHAWTLNSDSFLSEGLLSTSTAIADPRPLIAYFALQSLDKAITHCQMTVLGDKAQDNISMAVNAVEMACSVAGAVGSPFSTVRNQACQSLLRILFMFPGAAPLYIDAGIVAALKRCEQLSNLEHWILEFEDDNPFFSGQQIQALFPSKPFTTQEMVQYGPRFLEELHDSVFRGLHGLAVSASSCESRSKLCSSAGGTAVDMLLAGIDIERPRAAIPLHASIALEALLLHRIEYGTPDAADADDVTAAAGFLAARGAGLRVMEALEQLMDEDWQTFDEANAYYWLGNCWEQEMQPAAWMRPYTRPVSWETTARLRSVGVAWLLKVVAAWAMLPVALVDTVEHRERLKTVLLRIVEDSGYRSRFPDRSDAQLQRMLDGDLTRFMCHTQIEGTPKCVRAWRICHVGLRDSDMALIALAALGEFTPRTSTLAAAYAGRIAATADRIQEGGRRSWQEGYWSSSARWWWWGIRLARYSDGVVADSLVAELYKDAAASLYSLQRYRQAAAAAAAALEMQRAWPDAQSTLQRAREAIEAHAGGLDAPPV